MKKLILVFVFMLSFTFSVFAAGEEIVEESTEVIDAGTNVFVQNEIVLADGEDILTGVSVMSLSPVTPSDTNGFKAVLLELLGNYDPIIVEYEYQNSNSQYVNYLREVQPDYVWLCSAAFVLVVIYCLFRLGGAILCKR